MRASRPLNGISCESWFGAAWVSRLASGSQAGSRPPSAEKPSSNSGDGRYCFVSVSGNDAVSVINYKTAKEVARISVGDHPQRMRMGKIRRSYLR